VTVRVHDGDGGFVTSTLRLTVTNVAPTIVAITSTTPIVEGAPLTVTVSVSDPAGLNDPLTYSFDWDTDGVYDLLNQPSPVASHIYTATGVYTMTVRVSDGDGGLTTQTFTVTVRPPYHYVYLPLVIKDGATTPRR
jgi:PKD repeat protein